MSSLNKALLIGLTAKQSILLKSEEEEALSRSQVILYIGICVALTLVSGFFSGLTIGMASIDKLDIELLEKTGTPE